MKTTVWIAGDQVSPHNSALADCDKATTVVLMIESMPRSAERPHHKRKLVLIFAALRGFADDLRRAGWTVDFREACEDPDAALADHVRTHAPERFRTMTQTHCGLDDVMRAQVEALGKPLDVTPHCNFVSTAEEFAELFARGAARVTMETFYRRMRRKTGFLMDGDGPLGGTWNLDAENRKPPKRGMRFPDEPEVPLRPHARAAVALVERRFPDHPGSTDDFDIPTTRADALAYADDFFAHRLAAFGPYEDAMLAGELRLNHSRLSALINIGLLHPAELCERAEVALRAGDAPLQSVEGFVRQLIGWREFIWQTYRRLMPEYRTRNALKATLPVPTFFRDGETEMFCIAETMRFVLARGYAHHIMRLMILGNFALVAGIEPQAATDWFWEMFVDGWDWVMVPNVVGMTLHADGGIVGTKPYAASANYINKMSDFCGRCRYDPKAVVGDDACPYNSLYWDFIARNETRFARNPRMSLPLRNWSARDATSRANVRTRARALLVILKAGGRL